jgi:endonuclease YncB( thermonuclease family)
MIIPLLGLALVLLLFLPAFPMESYGHRSGCHAAHSCPSDTGSYVCGDTGNFSQCPGNHSASDEEESKKKKSNTTSKSNSAKSDPTLPSETISEGIEISGPVTYVVDGDTLDINDVRIRLSLVNTPEVGEAGFEPAKDFVESLCVNKNGQVDIDDGQRQGSFGREIGVVYCDGINLNSELIKKGYALISAEFCEVSEFANEPWAKSSCQMSRDENNNVPNNSNQDSDSLSNKQEQGTPFDSVSSESNETQSYSNSKLGISLKHPTDWKAAYLKNGIQFIKEENGVYVEIRKHNLEFPQVELKQYVGDDIKDRSSSRQDLKLLNITKTTISGNLPAYKATYTFVKTENQKDFAAVETTNKISRTYTFAQNNAYLVAYVADKDNYDLYLPIASKIIDTLKINPGSQQSLSEDDSNDNDKNNDSNDNDKNNDSNDNDKNNDSKDRDDGGDKDCSDFDKKNFKVQPGDPYDLDRDGDGIACEDNYSNDNDKNNDSNDNDKNNDSNDNDKNNDSNDNDKNNDSNDNDKNNDSNDEEPKDDGGDKDCSDFDKKNFKVQPGDPYDLDRDGDGIACEG